MIYAGGAEKFWEITHNIINNNNNNIHHLSFLSFSFPNLLINQSPSGPAVERGASIQVCLIFPLFRASHMRRRIDIMIITIIIIKLKTIYAIYTPRKRTSTCDV